MPPSRRNHQQSHHRKRCSMGAIRPSYVATASRRRIGCPRFRPQHNLISQQTVPAFAIFTNFPRGYCKLHPVMLSYQCSAEVELWRKGEKSNAPTINLRCKAVASRNLGNFNEDDTLQRKAQPRLPLFVFPHGFLRPLLGHEERLFISSIHGNRRCGQHGTRTCPIVAK